MEKMAVKIGVISLGCAKNRVDTEVMLGILKDEGYEFVQELDQADIALINTCSFTNDAKEESINTILEAEQQKRFGNLKGIIVVGCLPQRFKNELKKLLPRVDAYLGVTAYKDIKKAVKEVAEGRKYAEYADFIMTEEFDNRVVTTPKPTAYVKIAEGCDNRCSYCVIPGIRGPYQSRKMEASSRR
jgi:ribosomal protein S12 methylthiotransferase